MYSAMKSRTDDPARQQTGGDMLRYSILCLLLLIVGLGGCATDRQYLKVRRSIEVEKNFRSGKLLPQYRYYYTGPDGEPISLMALDRQYTLMSMFWHEFRSGAQLQGWLKTIDRIWGQLDDIEYVTIIYKGSEILSQDNTPIAMIYSKYDWVVAWFGENSKEIYITQPEPGGNQRAPLFFRRWHDR